MWVPHATAGLAVLETGAGSDDDLLAVLRGLLPPDDRVAAPARLARGTVATTCCRRCARRTPRSPCSTGAMALGTWQSVCLVDLNGDNPHRQVRLSFLPG